MYDQLDKMIQWESGELSDDETIALFQSLVDSGLAWQLQGCYGRTAQSLIDAGLINLPERKDAEIKRNIFTSHSIYYRQRRKSNGNPQTQSNQAQEPR